MNELTSAASGAVSPFRCHDVLGVEPLQERLPHVGMVTSASDMGVL